MRSKQEITNLIKDIDSIIKILNNVRPRIFPYICVIIYDNTNELLSPYDTLKYFKDNKPTPNKHQEFYNSLAETRKCKGWWFDGEYDVRVSFLTKLKNQLYYELKQHNTSKVFNEAFIQKENN